MDYESLLEGCAEMGCSLLNCGAEIHRVEDTVHRLLAAYGVEGEIFAIPNCLIVSITDRSGHVLTRMRRAEVKGTDLEGIEQYNALSRRLCAAPPEDPRQILVQSRAVRRGLRSHPLYIQLLGYFIGAFFFSFFFSGGILEAIAGGLAGAAAGGCMLVLGRTRSNFFINITVSGFVMAFVAYGLLTLGVPVNMEVVIPGAIMVLVPGLVFTNFMSNLLTGDIVAGLSTFARAVLSAGAIALGTGAAVAICRSLWFVPAGTGLTAHYNPLLYCLFAFIACLGFCFPYNVQGIGMLLCCLGGALGWAVYLPVFSLSGSNVYLASLCAAIAVAIYAETMARLRKCPTTPYLVLSYFPLVPGYTIYQAMDYGIRGESQLFLETFIRTFGIAGCLAIGALVVSTALRIFSRKKEH